MRSAAMIRSSLLASFTRLSHRSSNLETFSLGLDDEAVGWKPNIARPRLITVTTAVPRVTP